VDDTTTTRNTNTIQCSSSDVVLPVATAAMGIYRSKCPIDEIPEIARGLTWNDPFYDPIDPSDCTSTDIIAAFDLDRTLYDRSTYEIFKWFILIPIFSLICLPLYLIWGVAMALLLVYIIYGIFLSLIYLMEDCQRHEKRLRLKCTHIAIGTRCIYIDEGESPGSFNLMSRTRIPFDEIKQCQVISEYNCINRAMKYKITISTKDDPKVERNGISAFVPRYTIQGLQKQQKFVDIVNIMMERNGIVSSSVNSEVTAVPVES
jgi:hypothetical protein